MAESELVTNLPNPWRYAGSHVSMKYLAVFLLGFLPAGLATADTHTPSRAMIISVAQHFIQEQYMFRALGHYHIEFDVAYLHPQPQPNYWAVVGGFVSDQRIANTYVAVLRLICAEVAKIECWQLEKLAINDTIILDRGNPL